MLTILEAFVTRYDTVLQMGGEQRSRGVITNITWGKHQLARKAEQRIANGMNLCIEATARTAHGLLRTVFGPVGVLVYFAVSAVLEHNLGVFSEQQFLVKPIEESV